MGIKLVSPSQGPLAACRCRSSRLDQPLAQPPFYRAFSILGDPFSQTRLKPEEKARRKRAFPGGLCGAGAAPSYSCLMGGSLWLPAEMFRDPVEARELDQSTLALVPTICSVLFCFVLCIFEGHIYIVERLPGVD